MLIFVYNNYFYLPKNDTIVINNVTEVIVLFAGFNLSTDYDFKDYKSIGEEIFKNNKATISSKLEEYFDADGSIDGTTLQSDWFPQIECDVFLSHSHKDEDMAKGLAGWLNQMFGLRVFIDSCVWGYSLELQKSLDDKYCVLEDKTPTVYNYQKVMYSTSHVHMMLSTALTMMLDKTESVIFLNTPNSICTKNTINQTESPWLYHELAMTGLVRKRKLSEYREKEIIHKGYFNEQASLKIKYDVDTSHLFSLNQGDLDAWSVKFSKEYPLDTLYENKKVIELIKA